MSNLRKTLTAVAAIVLVSLTAACNTTDGGGGGKSGEGKPAGVSKVAGGADDSGTDDGTKGVAGGPGNPAICAEAVAATGDFMAKVMAAPTDHESMNKAISGHADTLKKLSERADGGLKAALSEMVDAFSQLDVGSATASEISKKVNLASKKLLAACS
ncbi:hypothetical protein [Microtetraspora sp. NBRC 16547]|uniref:hypothetical protein n=1 Tax=Microtetraspora sp. NBRC 16547 TaxID=3030993 RepID=UPI0024A4171B|nr:hypothetical protein [Microtetraspora sp. NBRC 16547]GLW99035.1 hypothetical protein Misp02_31220 [Microtetraspora sp. NBRC 16547]